MYLKMPNPVTVSLIITTDVILLYNNVYLYVYHRKTRGNPEVIFSNKKNNTSLLSVH